MLLKFPPIKKIRKPLRQQILREERRRLGIETQVLAS